MLVDGAVAFSEEGIGAEARGLEADGYDGLWVTEVGHDPFLMLAVAALQTERIELGTAIAVAFARSPMVTATLANDLQVISKGRLLLGLGSQIKPHIERRYSMPWSKPAERMGEYVEALRAIWASWQDGSPLDFRGSYYTHTLMTPFFSPGPNPYGAPKVFVAAVGERMTTVAGRVADGLLVHGFTTERYLRQVTLPAIERGLAAADRAREDFQVSYGGLVVTGNNDADMEAAAAAVREQIAFYGSTPAYRGVLELHGWGELQSELHALSRRGEWRKMGELVTDEVLEAFAVVAPPADVGDRVRQRYGDMVDRFSVYSPYDIGAETLRRAISGLNS